MFCYSHFFRGSLSEVFCEKGVLEDFAKLTGKYLSLFLIKLQAY